jgi:hypothetical protein
LLAEAEAAFAIPAHEAEALLAEGLLAERAGQQLEPAKTILFVTADRMERIRSARPIPVRLGPEFLESSHIALAPFPGPAHR